MTHKHYFIYIFLAVNILLLSACGVKPPYVDPPEGAEHVQFPQTYPYDDTTVPPGLENKNITK